MEPRVKTDKEIEQMADNIVEEIGAPPESASIFYTFMYLSEIEGVEELSYDYFKKRTSLRDAFIDYGIYACARELRNFEEEIRINRAKLNQVKKYREWNGIKAGGMEEFVAEGLLGGKRIDQLPPDSEEYRESFNRADKIAERGIQKIEEWKKENLTDTQQQMMESVTEDTKPQAPKNPNRYDFIKELESLQSKSGCYTEPEEFLEMCQKVFTLGDRISVRTPNMEINFSWTEGFGGESWSKIAEAVLNRSDLSDTAFCDMMWSVQHNNNYFIDKAPLQRELTKSEFNKAFSGNTEGSKGGVYQPTNDNRYRRDILDAYLYAARESKWGLLLGTVYRVSRNMRQFEPLFPNTDPVVLEEVK